MILTSRCEGRLLLHFHLLPTSGWDVVVDALVVVVHRHCQHLLGVRLADDVLVEVSIDLKQRDENKQNKYCTLLARRKHSFKPKQLFFSLWFSPSWEAVEASAQTPASQPRKPTLALCLAPSWSPSRTEPQRNGGISHIWRIGLMLRKHTRDVKQKHFTNFVT